MASRAGSYSRSASCTMTMSPVLIDSACRIAAPLPAVHRLAIELVDLALREQRFEDLARAVGRAVVDADDLFRDRRRAHLIDDEIDRVALVVDRNRAPRGARCRESIGVRGRIREIGALIDGRIAERGPAPCGTCDSSVVGMLRRDPRRRDGREHEAKGKLSRTTSSGVLPEHHDLYCRTE